MSQTPTALLDRLRAARERVGASQREAAEAIGVSQPTYSRIEDGTGRSLTGPDLVALADSFGVRVAAITGSVVVEERASFAARTDGSLSDMATMRERLLAYLELDEYLDRNDLPAS